MIKRQGQLQPVLEERKNFQLRERIKELEFQSHILQAQQEVSLDGILVVDSDWNMVSYNRRFVDMWQIPEDVLVTGDDKKSLQTVVSKLRDPDRFVERVEQLMAHPDEKSRDELELRDGRIFDRYSAPIFDRKNTIRGRVWFFRDITEIMQAREQLRQQNSNLEKEVFLQTRDLQAANEALLEREKVCHLQQTELNARNVGLRTLLYSLEEEKKHLEEVTSINFREALLPLLEALKETPLTIQQQHLVDVTEQVLSDFASSMNYQLKNCIHSFTPTEVRVANFIKAGKTSKEISVLLSASVRTVEGHRSAIRTKLGLSRNDNLFTVLLSLS